jgi:hypothetical protein
MDAGIGNRLPLTGQADVDVLASDDNVDAGAFDE